MSDDLVQDLAERIETWYEHGDPGWTGLARAVLACGLVVPTSDVLDLAQQWEDGWSRRMDYAPEFAAELRALTQQEPQ